MKTQRFLLLALTMLGIAATQVAAEAPSKWFQVEGLVNPESAFMIAVDVDSPTRAYKEGETMTVSVRSERECYVYLMYYSGESATMLFPNEHQPNNRIPANTTVRIPGEGDPFNFRTTGPFGNEVLHVVASQTKLAGLGKPDNKPFKALGEDDLKQMVVDVKKQKQQDWAEARIDITTFGKGGKPPKVGKRYGVAIGISQYTHDRIQDLQVSHLDAQRMADAFQAKCGLDEVILLTNEQATRANIEKAIFHDLVHKSRAGDTVFIFFSGHGGRCADQNGDEEDGFDEYLVPHDGILGKPETMIIDDTFARWMQELSGRHIAIILDNCYSGGASKSIDGDKFVPKSIDLPGAKGAVYDGMEMEMKRTKDLGQENTIVVAACQANQLAWEMPASQQGSVLTHYLIEALNDSKSDADQNGEVTMQEAYQYVQQKVEKYVKDKFQADQNPVIVDNAQDGVIFKQKQ